MVNFLDVTFDLSKGKYKPYRKPNDDPLYIDRHPNHPSRIHKQAHLTSLIKRASISGKKAPLYQNALRPSNFNHRLGYMKDTPQQ